MLLKLIRFCIGGDFLLIGIFALLETPPNYDAGTFWPIIGLLVLLAGPIAKYFNKTIPSDIPSLMKAIGLAKEPIGGGKFAGSLFFDLLAIGMLFSATVAGLQKFTFFFEVVGPIVGILLYIVIILTVLRITANRLEDIGWSRNYAWLIFLGNIIIFFYLWLRTSKAHGGVISRKTKEENENDPFPSSK